MGTRSRKEYAAAITTTTAVDGTDATAEPAEISSRKQCPVASTDADVGRPASHQGKNDEFQSSGCSTDGADCHPCASPCTRSDASTSSHVDEPTTSWSSW